MSNSIRRGRLELAERALKMLKGPEPKPDPAPPANEAESFDDLRAKQFEGARELLSRDLTNALRWPWIDLDRLVGPFLPGDVNVVGALTGNGKSTFVFSAIDAWSTAQVPLLYFPFEVDPAVYLNRRAAWRLEIDALKALRQQWADLPSGAADAMDITLQDLQRDQYVHLASEKRATVGVVRQRCEQAKAEFGCRLVIIDHIGRLEFGGDGRVQPRHQYVQMMKDLKDMARELELVVLLTAQLNRLNDPLDYFSPPHIARLAESAAIGHEADVTLMLSRRLKNDLPEGYTQLLRIGRLTEKELQDPGIMRVTCRKHRIDDEAMNRSAYLGVDNGRARDLSRRIFG